MSLPPGALPNPQAQLAPIIQAYMTRLQEEGVDRWYWLGAVQSPAYCPQDSGECFQVFQRQVLRWPRGSRNPADVQLSPLGTTIKGSLP